MDGFDHGLEVQLDRELRSMVAAGVNKESEEGLSALLARRPANFRST
ncbi:hypothetical protein [Sphingobium lactosutens]|nr:hypothetical protein [Sphingobium lactosutens]